MRAVLHLLISRKFFCNIFSLFLLNLCLRTLNSDFNFAISLKETGKHSWLHRDSGYNFVLQNWRDTVPEFTNLFRVSSQTLSEEGIDQTYLIKCRQLEGELEQVLSYGSFSGMHLYILADAVFCIVFFSGGVRLSRLRFLFEPVVVSLSQRAVNTDKLS